MEKKNLIYVRAFHLVWVKVVVKKYVPGYVYTALLRLFLARIRREGEERSDPERGRKRTSDLDFTNVCWQRNIRAFTVLLYFKITYGSR